VFAPNAAADWPDFASFAAKLLHECRYGHAFFRDRPQLTALAVKPIAIAEVDRGKH
jgi:hypothetical protein